MTFLVPDTPIDDFALFIAGRIDLQDTIEEDQKEEQQILWIELLHFDKVNGKFLLYKKRINL